MHLLSLVADRLWLVSGGRVNEFKEDLEAYRRLLLQSDEGEKKAKARADKRKKPSRDAVLALRADGFTSNLAPKGTVSWDNVAAISVKKYRGARNLVVALHDEARFLTDNGLKRGPTFRGNMAMFKAPIVIPQMRLSEKAEDIVATMQNLKTEAAP